jgi:hypothetical protein
MKKIRAFANMTPEQQRSHLLDMHGLYAMKRKDGERRKGTYEWKHDHDGAMAIQHVHSQVRKRKSSSVWAIPVVPPGSGKRR